MSVFASKQLPRQWKRWLSLGNVAENRRQERHVRLELEELETRALLSASSAIHPQISVAPQETATTPSTSSGISGYTPQQIRDAYGVNQIAAVSGKSIDGSGETIAIVDAYYDPNIVSDANTFNTQFSLPQFNGSSGGPTLTVVASGGGKASSLPQDSTGDWPLETSLDVEWAHAIAPQANILLVETADEGNTSMFNAVQYAAAQSGVVAVSMSWGDYEFSGETSYDSYFVPPKSNPGVTFVAASGDSGASSGPLYPATSPYVLAVGGTSLNTTPTSNGGATYTSESGWSGGGGGAAAYEGEPSYQYNQASINQTFGYPNVEVYNYKTGTSSYYYSRMTPDVAYNADPNTGYAIYDSTPSSDYSFAGGWTEVGGTSAGAPQWSAIVALSDQARSLSNGGATGAGAGKPLDTNQVQNTLYNTLSNSTTYASVFHDITTGSNGYSAGTGYDLATGLGSPIVNKLVPLLAGTTVPLGQLPTIQGSGYGGVGSSSSGALGSTSGLTTSGFGFSASARGGEGLYAGSGSLSIAPGSEGGNGSTGHAPGAANPTNPPVMPLASPLSSSAATALAAATPGSAVSLNNNPLFAFNSWMQGTQSMPSLGSVFAADSSNAPLASSTSVFGASGLRGPAESWRLSSMGLPGSQVEQVADDLAPMPDEESGDSSSGDVAADAGDTFWEDTLLSDDAAPALLDGDAGGGDE